MNLNDSNNGTGAPVGQSEINVPGEIRCGMLFLQTEAPDFKDGKMLVIVLSKDREYWRIARSVWMDDETGWSGFCQEESECPLDYTDDEILNWKWGRLRYFGMVPTLRQIEEDVQP